MQRALHIVGALKHDCPFTSSFHSFLLMLIAFLITVPKKYWLKEWVCWLAGWLHDGRRSGWMDGWLVHWMNDP